MAALAEARDWLTIFQLPPYAHELHPVEPVWSHLKRSLANLAGSRPPWQSSTRLQRKDAEQEERGGGHRSTKKRPPNVSCRKTAAARSAEYVLAPVAFTVRARLAPIDRFCCGLGLCQFGGPGLPGGWPPRVAALAEHAEWVGRDVR